MRVGSLRRAAHDRAPHTAPGQGGVAAATLGVATTVGHALSYAFSLVLSRALGPADFGALGALLGIAIVASVPAAALQSQVARISAVSPGSPEIRGGYRLGWVVGATLAVALAVAAIPLAALLRLDSALGVVLLGVGLIPVSALGARQGVLLGRGAFLLLAAATIAVPGLRLISAGVSAVVGVGVSGAVGLQAAATWVGLFVVMGLVHWLPRGEAGSGVEAGPRLSASSLLSAGSALLGLFVLANTDVLLARVFLSDTDSGVYAVAAIGTKVVFWGSQFVALLVFPRVVRREGGPGLVLRASALVGVVGVSGALLSVPFAAPVIDVVVGPAYASAAPFIPWFILLGTFLAVVQLSTYAAVAADRRAFSVLLWAAVVAQVAVIGLWAHGSIGQIVTVCLVVAGSVAVTALGAAVRGSRP